MKITVSKRFLRVPVKFDGTSHKFTFSENGTPVYKFDAVYTEEDCRGYGVAGTLLHHVCADMKENGIDTLYLVTDHTTFYERYGWSFLCMVHGESGMTRMYFHREGHCRGDNET